MSKPYQSILLFFREGADEEVSVLRNHGDYTKEQMFQMAESYMLDFPDAIVMYDDRQIMEEVRTKRYGYMLAVHDGIEAVLFPRGRMFNDEDGAESYGLYLIEQWPMAIVMLAKLEVETCRHCGQSIFERPGWILHKWAHRNTGAMTCILTTLSQAEPKEE